MNDNTKPTGVIVPLYSSGGGGRDSPAVADSGARPIQGQLMPFIDGRYYLGTSKYREEFATGTQLAVLEIRSGYKIWRDNKPIQFITEVDGRFPRRAELGYLDEREWPPGPGGKPTDPVQNSREILFIDPKTCAVFTFCSASAGGRSATDDLDSAVRNARLLRPGVVPLVSLEWQPMPTKYGQKSKPFFRILSWSIPNAEVTALAPPDGLNDAIPDLTK
jgi:hypothetical protein